MSIPFPLLTDHFAPLASRYDVAFCDVWGVIHNGVAPFPETVDALQRFRAGGGRVVLLTNAPRDGDVVVQFLDGLKVPRDAYDAVVTSGDVARAEIEARRADAALHIGPERDTSMFDDLDLRFTDVEHADYVICSGLYDDETETPDDYRDLLAAMRRRELFMVCANPDRVVERGNVLVYCAGAIADAYEAVGGGVMFTGKPYRPIYERALACAQRLRGADVPLDRVVAIGDSVRTDLRGASGFGIDCLFVTAGIHAEELGGRDSIDHGALAAIFTDAGILPAAVTRRLAW
ncbi:TIGR01459 family HAD-type hydrolase [Rhodoplanes roseus]|nr:TIGR01459 family HAD-type hydrolase [Rhodoplanes roseus]